MQYCILFVVAFALAAADVLPRHEVAFPIAKLVAILLCQLLTVFVAAVIALQTQAHANRVRSRESMHASLSLGYRLHMAVWLTSSICMLVCFDWANMLFAAENSLPFWVVRPLTLLPILSSLVLSWAVLFDAERAIDSSLDTSERWPYVIDRTRRFVLVPLAILVIMVTWSDLVAIWRPSGNNALLAFGLRLAPLVVIVATLPLLLRWSWNTKTLSADALRQRLETRGLEANCKTRDILVWDTRNRMANAAITGVLPGLRYLMLSDRLIRDLREEQVELIVLHELAHAKLRHQLKLILGIALSVGSSVLFAWTVSNRLSSSGLGEAPWSLVGMIGCVVVAMLSVRIVGRFARGLELEADLWAATISEKPREYLLAVAHVASGNPRQATWLHPSFQERCDLLLNGLEPASVYLRSELRANFSLLATWVCVIASLALFVSSQ